MEQTFVSTCVQSCDKRFPFHVASLRGNSVLSFTSPNSCLAILDAVCALELASALIAHAERLCPDLPGLSPAIPNPSRETRTGSMPILDLMNGHALVDVLLVIGAAFLMPIGLHYGFELLGM